MRTPTRLPSRPLSVLATLICAAVPMVAFAHGKPHQPPQLSPARPATLIGSCEGLQTQLAGLPDTVITGSSTVAAGTLQVAGQPVPEHCRVTGRMNDRIGLDGRPYAIGFELRLPVEWNGRFWYQGNGGIDGSVVPATGALGAGPLTHALAQGFAVISSDAGHPAAYGPTFGIDPQARLDYGYPVVPILRRLSTAFCASSQATIAFASETWVVALSVPAYLNVFPPGRRSFDRTIERVDREYGIPGLRQPLAHRAE